MVYEQSSGLGFGKILLILLVIGIIFVVSLLYFGILTTERIFSWFGFQPTPKSLVESQFTGNSFSNTLETNFCKRQNIPTNGVDSPISISRLGYSVEQECCWDKVDGYQCGMQEISTFYKCQTADINGVVKAVLYQNKYLDPMIGISMIKGLRNYVRSC